MKSSTRYAFQPASILFAVLLSLGCNEVDVEAPPRVMPPPPPVDSVLSFVPVPVEIPLSEVSTLVNRVIPQQLHTVEGEKIRKGLIRGEINLDIRRNGDIIMQTADGYIDTDLPLKVDGTVRIFPAGTKSFSTTFVVHARSEVSLDTAWTTLSQTRGRFTWRKKPFLTVLGFNIDVSGIAGRQLDHQLTILAPRIDQIIEDKLDLRRIIERIWDDLSEPVLISRNPSAWLIVKPVDVRFYPAVSNPDTVIYGLRIATRMATHVGVPPETRPLLDLPHLHTETESDSLEPFQVSMPVTVTYEQAGRLLTQALAERPIEVGEDITVRISEVTMYPNASSLIVGMTFRAHVKNRLFGVHGRVFMTGKPVFDPETSTVRIDSFNYDIRSRNALASMADWMLHDSFVLQAQEMLQFSVADQIEFGKRELEEALRDRTLGRHLLINATISDLTARNLYLSPYGITVVANARGRLSARVQALHMVGTKPRRDSTQTL